MSKTASTKRYDQDWRRLTNTPSRMRVRLPKDEELRRFLVFEIIPLLGRVVMHLHILRDFGIEYYVCGG